MRIYIIAGEASGDLHASNFVRELKTLYPHVELRGWGGDLMREQGVDIVKHYRDLAFMGFIEVVKNLRTILRNMKTCVQDIEQFKPDAVVMVDYPGFNLRVAEKVKPLGCKIFYYISPQVWAWKQSRVHQIKKLVDKMFVILPFEKDFYRKFDYQVEFVGHPLLDAIAQFKQEDHSRFREKNQLDNKPIIALLPGSRKQEILVKLPIMLSVIDHFPQYQFVVAAAPSQPLSLYDQFKIPQKVAVVQDQTYALLLNAHAALVTSGTATLETALFHVPEVVCYKGSAISYQIAKRLVKVKYISLVNLIADKPVVKELIQADLNTTNLLEELRQLTAQGPYRQTMLENFTALEKQLGGPGASRNVAIGVLTSLGQSV